MNRKRHKSASYKQKVYLYRTRKANFAEVHHLAKRMDIDDKKVLDVKKSLKKMTTNLNHVQMSIKSLKFLKLNTQNVTERTLYNSKSTANKNNYKRIPPTKTFHQNKNIIIIIVSKNIPTALVTNLLISQ